MGVLEIWFEKKLGFDVAVKIVAKKCDSFCICNQTSCNIVLTFDTINTRVERELFVQLTGMIRGIDVPRDYVQSLLE